MFLRMVGSCFISNIRYLLCSMRKTMELCGRCGFQGIRRIRIAASCQMPCNSMTFFHELKFSCHFRKLAKSPFFSGIFWHNWPVIYFVLSSSPAIKFNNLRTTHSIISMTFHDQQLNSMTFQAFHFIPMRCQCISCLAGYFCRGHKTAY